MANRIVDIPKKKPPRTTASKKKSSAIKSAGKGSPFRQSLTKKKQDTPVGLLRKPAKIIPGNEGIPLDKPNKVKPKKRKTASDYASGKRKR